MRGPHCLRASSGMKTKPPHPRPLSRYPGRGEEEGPHRRPRMSRPPRRRGGTRAMLDYPSPARPPSSPRFIDDDEHAPVPRPRTPGGAGRPVRLRRPLARPPAPHAQFRPRRHRRRRRPAEHVVPVRLAPPSTRPPPSGSGNPACLPDLGPVREHQLRRRRRRRAAARRGRRAAGRFPLRRRPRRRLPDVVRGRGRRLAVRPAGRHLLRRRQARTPPPRWAAPAATTCTRCCCTRPATPSAWTTAPTRRRRCSRTTSAPGAV